MPESYPLTVKDRTPQKGDKLMKVGAYLRAGMAVVCNVSGDEVTTQYGPIDPKDYHWWHYMERADSGPVNVESEG